MTTIITILFINFIALLLNINSNAACSMSLSDAIQWINESECQGYDLDGWWGYQCSDYVSAYINYVQNGSIYGNYGVYYAYYYPYLDFGDDFVVYANTPDFLPQPGDIFVSAGNTDFQHVGLVLESSLSTATVLDQNSRNSSLEYGAPVYKHTITWAGEYTPYYFIRPNFADERNYMEIQEVPYGIKNKATNMYLTFEENTVKANHTDFSSSAVTHIIPYGEGNIIKFFADNKVVNPYCTSVYDGAPINMLKYYEGDVTQLYKFEKIDDSGTVVIRSYQNPNLVVTSDSEGNLSLKYDNGSDYQKFIMSSFPMIFFEMGFDNNTYVTPLSTIFSLPIFSDELTKLPMVDGVSMWIDKENNKTYLPNESYKYDDNKSLILTAVY